MFNKALEEANMVTRILRLPEVVARTGLSRSSIYLRVSQNNFPKSISLGGRSVGWVEEQIEQWLERQIAAAGAGDEK